MSLPFDFDTTRTVFADDGYAAIGHGLTFATRFEANFRAVAAMKALKILISKSSFGSSDDRIADAIAHVTEEHWHKRRLRHHTESVGVTYSLPRNARAAIVTGRVARNELVHEFALTAQGKLDSDEGRLLLLNDLATLISRMAEADRIVAILMQLENQDPLPTAAHFDSYVRRAVAWVCDIAA